MSTSFPQILSTEAGRLLVPLKELDTPARLVAYLHDLGYSFTGALGSLNLSALVIDVDNLIARIKDLVDSETDEDEILAAIDLLEQIIVVAGTFKNEIPNIQTALNNVSSLTAEGLGNFLPVFLRRMVDHLVYTYLQEYRPPIFWLSLFDRDRRPPRGYAVRAALPKDQLEPFRDIAQ